MTALDLHPRAGIPATLETESLALRFGTGVSVAESEQRTADALRSVLLHPDAVPPHQMLYTLYRGITPSPAAAEESARRGLVFVALVLRPGTIGDELARTRGHVNSPAPGTRVAYPEVHEIWHGQGLLYLQCGAEPDAAQETVTVRLGPGDKAVVAPGWASLLVNVGTEPLVVGSWRSVDCVLQHDALAALGGMAHYLLPGDSPDAIACVPNPRYGEGFPAPRAAAARELTDFGLTRDEPMLTSFRRNPDFLRFMQRPQDYADVWAELYGDV